MANGVHSTDLNTIVDRLNGAGRRDANNLALADQIQFSSILRTLVDTPEQTLDVVADATQAREADKARPDATDRKTRPARRVDRERDTERETEQTRREPKTEQAAANGLKPVTAPQEPEAPKPVFEPSVTVADAPEQVAVAVHAKRVGLETGRAPDAVAALVASRTAELGPPESPEQASAKSQALLINAAQSIASGALADRNFSRVGEDLHDATMQRLAQVGRRAGGPTAANSLKQQQEVDLAGRLGLDTPVAIQVDTQDAQAKVRATPIHNLSGGTAMAALEGMDAELDSFAQAFGRNTGDNANAGAEMRAPSHGALLGDRALAAANATDFNQMLRAQGALLAAQQAGQGAPEAKPVLAAEVSQINGVGAPTGPSQVSQTAKANPTTAARQPERPQTPAEQISVKIRQAVDEGLDKINIKLNPAHLGRVEVRLNIKDGNISATVLAERQETLDLLQKDVRGLEKALQDAGLRTDVASISFGLRGDGQKQIDLGRERRHGTQDRSAGRMNDTTDRDEGISGAAMNNARNLRSSGGVDIRV